MDITIHQTYLPHDDPDVSLVFYRDVLGFEVRTDVGSGKMRWIEVGPVDQPGTSILLAPPAADPGITEDERRTIAVEPRSAYLMTGPSRTEWEHSIPPLAEHRYSITLRTLRSQSP